MGKVKPVNRSCDHNKYRKGGRNLLHPAYYIIGLQYSSLKIAPMHRDTRIMMLYCYSHDVSESSASY